MKKKLLTGVLVASLVLSGVLSFAGCGNRSTKPTSSAGEITADDIAKAKHVADLIDAIYVQKATATTEADCKAAKAAWDALTDTQKELVEGEYADPDYFGRDTGNAAKDDPLNSDKASEKEILVVSFGTSFNDSRAEDIGGIEKAIAAAFPDYTVRRAFTAQIIINHIFARDGEKIDNVEEALEIAKKSGVKELIVQPTHLMHGAEYDELIEVLSKYQSSFSTVKVAEPLLGESGVNPDKKAAAEAAVKNILVQSDIESIEEAEMLKKAIVLIGHGTSHAAKVTYAQMQTVMNELGYNNVFIGTVEGEPEETACENVIKTVKEKGYESVIMAPLMVVGGDHANNDMAGEDADSWYSRFTAAGFKELVCMISGLGRIPAIQSIYVSHTSEAVGVSPKKAATTGSALQKGEYKAYFKTDSMMFRVNEADNDIGILTVDDGGKMTIKVNLVSKNIVKLYAGKASDAENDKAGQIEPIESTVTYSDGSKEDVYAFEIPVPALDKDFDVAILGTKGKWYDHVCSVKLA